MKKTILILIIFMCFSTINAQTEQTEEYAIVDVFEYLKKKVIRVTIGEDEATEKEWKAEKTKIAQDFSPVIKELHELNKMGFTMLNMSTTYSNFAQSTGIPRFTFIMVRKIE